MTLSQDTVGRPTILKPYAADPDSRARKRMRLVVTIMVCAFCLVYGLVYAFFTPYLLVPLAAPLAIGGLICIWALPETRRAPTGAVAALTYVFFGALVMWPNYIAVAPPGLPWITIARLTGLPLVFLLLVCVSVSHEFRSRLAHSLNSIPIIWKMIVLFVIIQTISIAFSNDKGTSVDKWVVFQTNWTATFFVSAYVFLKPGRIERMAAALWIMAILVGIVGVIEWRANHVLWAGHIPSFLQIPDAAVASALASKARGGDGLYRAQSTFSTSLGLAEYVALTMPFVLQFAFGAYRRLVRTAAFLSIPFMLFTVYVTGSRLGAVGCLMSFFLYSLVLIIKAWRANKHSILPPAAFLAYPFTALVVGFGILFWPRLHNAVLGDGAAQASTQSRQEQLHLAIPKILSHPWGYGISRGADALGYYGLNGMLTLDSYYLTIALDYGVVGFLVYYGLLATTAFNAAKFTFVTRRADREYDFMASLAIAIANFFVIKSVFSQQDNHPIVFMYVGMIVALAARLRDDRAADAQATPAAVNQATRRIAVSSLARS